MNWLALCFAGVLEIFWATCLKYSMGFTKPIPSALTVIGSIVSFYFLAYAMRTLSFSTSYAVWTGIGGIGSVIVGVVLFGEPLSFIKSICVCFIFAGIIGLKMISQVD